MWKAFFLLFLIAATAAGDETARENWRVWIEPKFMRAPVSVPIVGAKRSELVAGTLEAGVLTPLAANGLEAAAVTREQFFAQARENAARDLAEVTTEYTRNRKRVIEYAEIRSARGLLPSAVLAPKFLAQFQDTLGPEVVLVIPNRFTGYVFPKLASRYREYSESVLAAYRATSYPVSLEVFELSGEGMKAVGVYPDPGRD